jgi:tetratricopeptide (TPR) repeat protein
VRYVGVGVGKRWNRAWMKLAAERSGGYFTHVNPDEPLAWRAFELLATLNTPRLLELRVVDDDERVTFLCDAASLAQGEEVCAIARIPGKAGVPIALPKLVTVAGKLDGKPYVRKLLVQGEADGAGYLPRTWAKLEIDRLLAEDGAKHKDRIVALSKAMYVMSPFTSLLVLETEADYARFKVDRGRKDHWAMYSAPAKIPVVYEPRQSVAPPAPATGKKKTAADVLRSIILPRVALPNLAHRGDTEVITLVYGLQNLSAEDLAPEVQMMLTPNLGSVHVLPTSNSLLLLDTVASLKAVEQTIRVIEANQGKSNDRRTEVTAGTVRTKLRIHQGVDEARLRMLAQGWGQLGEQKRIELLREMDRLTRDLPPRHKLAIQEYYRGLADPKDPRLNPYLNLIGRDPAINYYGYIRPETEGELSDRQRAMGGFGKGGFGGGFGGRGFGGPGGFGRPGGFGGGPGGFGGPTLSGLGNIAAGGGLPLPRGTTPHQNPYSGYYGNPYGAGFGPYFKLAPITSLKSGQSEVAQRLKELPPGTIIAPRLPVRVESIPGVGVVVIRSSNQQDREAALKIVESIKKQDAKSELLGLDGIALLYQRPSFTVVDPRVFGDLVSYAPGLYTTEADIAAVLEAEAPPEPGDKPGIIDPAARALIDKARAGGWQAATIPGQGKRPAVRLVFNPAGQFFLDHVLESGLREIIVCDGKTLRHLYPEIGLGARRPLSRFHRAELLALLPWLLPPAEDLARGADLTRLDEHTVALAPRGAAGRRDTNGNTLPYVQVRLVFADGRLSERRVALMPAGKVLSRETYSGGVVKLYAGDGEKPALEHTIRLAAAKAPDLAPDTAKLVMVPMPLRTHEHLSDATLAALEATGWGDWSSDFAISFIAAKCATQDGLAALRMFASRFHAKGDRRLGFYTLLASSGHAIDPNVEYRWAGIRARIELPPADSNEPLARYLACHNVARNRGDRGPLGQLGGPATGFVQRLAALRDLCRHWDLGGARSDVIAVTRAEVEKAVAFARDVSPQFAWPLLNTVQKNLGSADHATVLLLSGALRTAGEEVGMGYTARYEHAAALHRAGKGEQARAEFRKLHADALKAGVLPPIDRTFRDVLLTAPQGETGWQALVRQTARQLVREHGAASVLTLVQQVAQVGDGPLAEELCEFAVESASKDERPLIALAGVQFLASAGQHARAAAQLEPLLKDKRLGQAPGLWRLAADLAARRKLPGRVVAYLEKALDLEYRDLPEVVNLEQVRGDYAALLMQYRQLANALTLLETEPARDFVAKVVRAADRWRALDPDATAACQAAGRILRTLGEKELAWDYLTTPVGQKPNESGPWASLAQVLRNDGEFDLADRAYATAFAAEQTNAQLLWDRAENLRQAGRWEAARRVYRQLADGTWQDRFAGLKQQARSFLEAR